MRPIVGPGDPGGIPQGREPHGDRGGRRANPDTRRREPADEGDEEAHGTSVPPRSLEPAQRLQRGHRGPSPGWPWSRRAPSATLHGRAHPLGEERRLVDRHDPQEPHGPRVERPPGQDIVVRPEEPEVAARAEEEPVLVLLHVDPGADPVARLHLAITVRLGLRREPDLAHGASRQGSPRSAPSGPGAQICSVPIVAIPRPSLGPTPGQDFGRPRASADLNPPRGTRAIRVVTHRVASYQADNHNLLSA